MIAVPFEPEEDETEGNETQKIHKRLTKAIRETEQVVKKWNELLKDGRGKDG